MFTVIEVAEALEGAVTLLREYEEHNILQSPFYPRESVWKALGELGCLVSILSKYRYMLENNPTAFLPNAEMELVENCLRAREVR